MEEIKDVGDAQQTKKRKTAYELRRLQELEWAKSVLDTYSGRAFVWHILEMTELHGAIPSHPQDSFRGLGRRDVGMLILEELFTVDYKYEIMMRDEAMARRAEQEGK